MRYESVVLSRLVRIIVRRGIEISTESECSRLRNDFDQIAIFYDFLQHLPDRSAARFVNLDKDEIARRRCDVTASRSVWDCYDGQCYRHSDDQDDNGHGNE